ncbi:MAG: hypothetical protein GY838_17965 [bacterium]|nr:hypothetical protein [bacterium]
MKRCAVLTTGMCLVLLAASTLAPDHAAASTWCGENGVVHLRFGETVDGPGVLEAKADEIGLTKVTLSAWLMDVEPVAIEGEAFLSLGGYELQLVVKGAKPLTVRKILPEGIVDLAGEPAGCLVGLNRSLRLTDEGVKLVSWEILFQGETANVRFELKPEGILTCESTSGCPGSGTRALYIGSNDAQMLSEVFGAGCQPAVLNFTGKPNMAVQRGNSGWRDVGRAAERKSRR